MKKVIITAVTVVLLLSLAGSAFGVASILNVSTNPKYICPGQPFTVIFMASSGASPSFPADLYSGAVISADSNWNIPGSGTGDYLISGAGNCNRAVPINTNWFTYDNACTLLSSSQSAAYMPYTIKSTMPTGPGFTEGTTVHILVSVIAGWSGQMSSIAGSAGKVDLPVLLTCQRDELYNSGGAWYAESDPVYITVRDDCYSPTNTGTPTDTGTPTYTSTHTPTNTPIGTPVDTSTPTNTFTATQTYTPTNTPTDTFTMTVTPTHTPMQPDLEIIATPSTMSIASGTMIEVKIYVKNNGGGDARNVTITNTIPPEMKLTDTPLNSIWTAVGNSVSMVLPDMPYGDVQEFSIYVEAIVSETDTGMIIMPPFTATYNGDIDPPGVNRIAMSGMIPFWIGEIKVYPNPFNPNKAFGGVLKFINLPYGSQVIIYTVSGEQVVHYNAITQAVVFWDGNNAYGNPASAGIYYYIIYSTPQLDTRKVLKMGKIFMARD